MKISDPVHRRGGFTLLELLVAVTITVLLVGVMIGVTAITLRQWGRDQARLSQAIAAKQVLDLLERDLQAALWRRDSNHWLAVDLLSSGPELANHGWLMGTGLMKPAGAPSLRTLPADEEGELPTEGLRFGLSGAWLRFVTTNIESGGGLPAVVAYQIARRPVIGNPITGNPAPVHYALYRSVVSTSETFAKGYDVIASAYGSTNNTPSSALSTAYRQSRNVTNPSHANLLASNVVDFGCLFYARDTAGSMVRIFPQGPDDVSHVVDGNSGTDGTRMPEVVDVFVRILGETGATEIAALEAGQLFRPEAFASDADWWWGVVEADSQVFFRRIEIRGNAP